MPLRRCAQCGFRWAEKAILPDTYYDTDWDAHVDVHKLESRRRNGRDRLRFVERFVPKNRIICDLGTGEGLMVEVLSEAGYDAMGIEPSERGVAYAQGHGLHVVRGTAETLRVVTRDRRVGAVSMFHVIEHLLDPQRDLSLIFDALESGGILIIETPNLRGFSARRLGDDWPLIYPEHLFYFDDCTLPALVRGAGFSVMAQGSRNFDPSHLPAGEALFRLGLRQPRPRRVSELPRSSSPATVARLARPSALHARIAVRILSGLVQMLDRTDYLWLVARKP